MIMRILAGCLSIFAIIMGLDLLIFLTDSWLEKIRSISIILSGILFGMYALRGNRWNTYFRTKKISLFLYRIVNRNNGQHPIK
jgi:hypothetical protein